MTVRTYYCWRDGSIWTVRTDRPIPNMWAVHGLLCKRCMRTYPECGPVEDVLRDGCGNCRSRSELANVYEYGGVLSSIKEPCGGRTI